jgi:hypothetical protein
MTIAEKIQILLLQMHHQNSFEVKGFYVSEWGENEVEFSEIIRKMLAERMIKPIGNESSFCITILGERIVANGGWVKFSTDRMKNLAEQHERTEEYAALKTRNESEKLENEAKNLETLASASSPTGNGGMSFQGVMTLIAALAALAVLIWVLR